MFYTKNVIRNCYKKNILKRWNLSWKNKSQKHKHWN
ncbi:hypothetical protein YTXLTZUM_CDS0183 [Enterococcus phage VRE9_3]